MKIILMENRKGTYLKKPGEYTRVLDEALDFETAQAARRFCSAHNVSGHVIVAKFPHRALSDVILGKSED